MEVPPNRWDFPDPAQCSDEHGIVAVGADLEPGTLLAAYERGIFPMPVEGTLVWWSPDPRAVLDELHLSRSARRARKRFSITRDTAFTHVIDGCANRRRPGGWITPRIRRAYVRLHDLGWAHSVEAWSAEGTLAGGVYGVRIGNLFTAESMFHSETDASKAALAGLVDWLGPDVLLDVQWLTPHLASLGATEIPRTEYLTRLAEAVTRPAA